MRLPRNAQLWLPGYVGGPWRRQPRPGAGQGRLWVAICDHYEPLWNNVSESEGRERVALWTRHWPSIAARHRDSAGHPPQYTFFYPEDEYRPELVAPLAEMTRAGIADVEVHIHHDERREGAGSFLRRMRSFLEILEHSHGLLRRHEGQLRFGFIHGNWALDNGRPDGAWCGLNNEITMLRDLGCYADFTMPSGASPTQSRILNEIYWAVDDPERPRSYEQRSPAGAQGTGDLLMIPGPFGLRWRGLRPPRIEAGELAGYDLPEPYRVGRWLDLAPVSGRDVILKLFTHGTQERNSQALLTAGGLDRLFELLAEACRIRGWSLHFATAWQLAQTVAPHLRSQPEPARA